MSCYSANSGLQPANIKKFLVTSNYGGTLDLKGGVVDFRYYESVLDTTVRVSSTIVDTGGRYGMEGNTGSFEDDKVKKGKGDDQNLTGGEKVELEFEDNFGQTIKFNELRVKKLRDYLEDAKFTSYGIDLYSREAIDNELDKFRVHYLSLS